MGRKLYAKGEGFNPSTSIEDVEGLREELDALKGGSGSGGGDNTAIERRLSEAEGEIDDLQRDVAEQSERVAAVGAKVNTLQGTDAGKSVRTIAAEETAKIVGNAPANYDTLKEIADYIASDATGAAEMSNKINKNTADIAKLAKDLDETHLLASNAESAISEVVESTIPAIEDKLENKLGKNDKAADSAKADVANNSTLLGGKYAYQYGQNILNETVDIDAMPNGVRGGKLFNASASAVEFPAKADGYGAFLSAAYGKYGLQFIGRHDGYLYARVNDNVVRQWKQIAFTDSTVANAEKLGDVAASDYMQKSGGTFTGNVTAPKFIGALQGNADSATKLATPRTIWGQSFDGTGDITGTLTSDIWRILKDQTYDGTFIQSKNYAGTSNLGNIFITAWAGNRLSSFNVWADKSTFSGNVAIGGTTNPTEKLEVAGNIKASGTMTATATYHSSDERLKTFEGDVEVDLEKLKALPKKYFHWTADADGKRQLGTSAQAVEEIFPELVSTDANGYKSVNYANLSVVALAAVDKLAEQNTELKRRLAKIEKLLNIE